MKTTVTNFGDIRCSVPGWPNIFPGMRLRRYRWRWRPWVCCLQLVLSKNRRNKSARRYRRNSN